MRGWWIGAVLLCGGCANRLERRVVRPSHADALDAESPTLKVHLRSGELVVLHDWIVSDARRTVRGTGERFDLDRTFIGRGTFEIPIADVALFETNVVVRSPLIASLAVVTTISAIVTTLCIASPKSCFGSCPTFYAPDGDGESLMAEAFSASIAPSLEDTDVDALYRARPADRHLVLRMTNEAQETHFVRSVHVLAAKRPAGGRVFATSNGVLRGAESLAAPTSCSEGAACAQALAAFDGTERRSLTDPEDLGARETIDLAFDAPASGPLGVVFAARQSFVSTFLFYQSLAFLGRHAGDAIAALERGDSAMHDHAFALAHAVGAIEVEWEDADGRFVPAGEVMETGPIATDVHLVTLPEDARPRRIRLRMAQGSWRLDWVALARLGEEVTPVRLAPTQERGEIVTLPGDEVSFQFDLPDDPERLELFLESRGYYLEWMRHEWLAEENPLRAALMWADPARALKTLAPEFKRREATMEETFWGSRYAR